MNSFWLIEDYIFANDWNFKRMSHVIHLGLLMAAEQAPGSLGTDYKLGLTIARLG